MDETMSGEAVVLNVIHEITNKLKLLCRKKDFSTPAMRHFLLINLKRHFDYACSASYPYLTKRLKHRMFAVRKVIIGEGRTRFKNNEIPMSFFLKPIYSRIFFKIPTPKLFSASQIYVCISRHSRFNDQ